MTLAVFPGSFDPVTVGHLDVARRALRVADTVVVAVGINAAKTPMFDVERRVDFWRGAARDLEGVRVERMEGLLVDFCRRVGADFVIKGVRDGVDFSAEMTQAGVNRDIGDVETLFLPTRPEHMTVSSTLVRELISWGMDVSRYVPPEVAAAVADNGVNRSGATR